MSKMKYFQLSTFLLIFIVATSFSVSAQFLSPNGVLRDITLGGKMLCDNFQGYPGDRLDCRATYQVVVPGKSLVEVCIQPFTGFLASIFATPTNYGGQCVPGQTFCYSYMIDSSNAKAGDVTEELHFYPTVPTPDSKAWSTTGDGYGTLYNIVTDSFNQCCNVAGGCTATAPYSDNSLRQTKLLSFTVLERTAATPPATTLPEPTPDSENIDVTPTHEIPAAPTTTPTGFFDIVDEIKFLQTETISYKDVSPNSLIAGRKVKALVYVKNTGTVVDTMKIEGGIYPTAQLTGEFGLQALFRTPKDIGKLIDNCGGPQEKNVQSYEVTLQPGDATEIQFVVDAPAVAVPNTEYSFFTQTFRNCYKDVATTTKDTGSTDYRIVPLTFTKISGRIAGETCSDGLLNQDETGVDCGGVCGTTCRIDTVCNNNCDCAAPLICKSSNKQLRCEPANSGENGTAKLCDGKPCADCKTISQKDKPSAISLTAEEYDTATDVAIISAMCELPTECSDRDSLPVTCLGGEDVRVRNEEAVIRVETRIAAGGNIGDFCQGASSVLAKIPGLAILKGVGKDICIAKFSEVQVNKKLLSGTCRAGETGFGFSGIAAFFKSVGELLGLTGSTATAVGASIVVGLGLLILNMVFGRKN